MKARAIWNWYIFVITVTKESDAERPRRWNHSWTLTRCRKPRLFSLLIVTAVIRLSDVTGRNQAEGLAHKLCSVIGRQASRQRHRIPFYFFLFNWKLRNWPMLPMNARSTPRCKHQPETGTRVNTQALKVLKIKEEPLFGWEHLGRGHPAQVMWSQSLQSLGNKNNFTK